MPQATKKKNLRAKVLSTMFLVSALPLLVVGVLAVYSLNYFHEQDLQTIEQTVLDQTAQQINNEIGQVLESMEVQVGFSQTDDIRLQDQTLLLEQLASRFPELNTIAFISTISAKDTYGYETAKIIKGQETLTDPELLQNLTQTKKFIVASTGGTYKSEIYHTAEGPMITLAVPIHNTPNPDEEKQPEVIMVLTADLKLSRLSRVLRLINLGNTGYLYLLDQTGRVLYASRPDLPTPNRATLPTGSSTERYLGLNGEHVIGLNKNVPGLPLRLVAEWPASDADMIVNTVRQQLMLALLAVLLLAVIFSFIVSSRIVRPIRLLEAGAQLVAQGKFDQPVNISTGDELEQLGEAHNQMIKGLKRLEELKDEFVFIASHELRTPVTAIKGYLSMVLNGEAGTLGDEAKQMLEQVQTANQRLIQLVEDLLQVARNDAGRLKIEVTPTDLATAIDSVTKELLPLANDKQQTIRYDSSKSGIVAADNDRLKEVLINLVGNAIKYTPAKGTIEIFHEQQPGMLVTHIKDDGIGMSQEEQAKLFEKFYRVKNTKTASISGTGLGLFIVKQIVEKMGGQIWVTSAPEQGSTFSFSLKKVRKSTQKTSGSN